MTEKTLLILANSFKNQGRCIAGREIWLKEGRASLGCWVRPIGNHTNGELFETEWHYPDRSPLAVGDVARVKLSRPTNDPGQPENWVLGGPWQRVQRAALPGLPLEETHADLWPGFETYTDRVAEEEIKKSPPLHSICILRPEGLRLVFSTHHKVQWNKDQKRYRAHFGYNGRHYALSLTDPVWTAKYADKVPPVGRQPLEVVVEGTPLISVSLTPPFNGFHYKVCATVIA